MATGRELLPTRVSLRLSGHVGPVNVARYNSAGAYVLSGGSDRVVKLWNSKSGLSVQTYSGHSHEIHAVDVSADSGRFASGGSDKAVFVWDVTSGSIVRRVSEHTGKINDVRFAGAGDSVLATAGFDATVRLYDLRAHGAWRPIMALREAKDAVMALALTPDTIYSASVDGRIRAYDLRQGQLRTDLIDVPISSVQPSRTGSSILVASLDNTVRLLDSQSGTALQTFSGHKHVSYRCRASFSQQEDAVILGDETGHLHAWDVISAEPRLIGRHQEKAHNKAILWTEVNPDPNTHNELLTASADGSICIWDSARDNP